MLYAIAIILAIIGIVAYHTVLWTAATVATLFVLNGLGLPALFRWVIEHPVLTVTYVLIYIAIGAAWSVVKWWFAETNRLREFKENFARDYGINPEKYAEQLARAKSNPVRYKSDITFWISFWPLSAVYTLLNDPVRRAARRIYAELQGVYQRITDHVWKG
jgi:hypothetical protein